MKIKHSFRFLFLFLVVILSLSAKANGLTSQQDNKNNVFDFFYPIKSSSSVSFFQDKRIEQIFLDRQENTGFENMRGFRVQVFSSNQPQKAKDEAYKIEKLIEQKFPNEQIYVSYSSPFWKVRVGNFRTEEEAKVAEHRLKRAFPKIKQEIYVVRDEIKVSLFK